MSGFFKVGDTRACLFADGRETGDTVDRGQLQKQYPSKGQRKWDQHTQGVWLQRKNGHRCGVDLKESFWLLGKGKGRSGASLGKVSFLAISQ